MSNTNRRPASPAIIIAVSVVIAVLGCIFTFTGHDITGIFSPTATPFIPTAAPASLPTAAPGAPGASGWLTVYFTDPAPLPKASFFGVIRRVFTPAIPKYRLALARSEAAGPDTLENLSGGVDSYVTQAIDAAQFSVDIASFDFNLPSVTEALARAAKRGVKVRLVLDELNGSSVLKSGQVSTGKDFDALEALKKARIKVVDGGRSNGLMHDKMVIIDGRLLFMGSWNLSYNDTFRNDNNLLRITAPEVIANYQAKFEEMYTAQAFGANAQLGALRSALIINGVQVENYFSPVDHVMDKLLHHIHNAKRSIHFMVFTYTHQDLAAAMIERAQAGVDVQGVIEARGASQGAFPSLFCAGIPVLEDGNRYTMHHKVIIIDGQIVITGSYNFTKSADDSNDDNVFIIHDASVAAAYEAEYQKMYAAGQPPSEGEITCR